MQPVPCPNCGAAMAAEPDGRTHACRYCGARVEVAFETAQIAAGSRLDLDDPDRFLAQLASVLAKDLADRTRVEARGDEVDRIDLDLDTDLFIARRSGSRIVTEHKKSERGIVLRATSLPLDQWVELLGAVLTRRAGADPRAAWVLAQIATKG
jgi:hypothetical protein